MDQDIHALRMLVHEAFPPVERPADDALTVHGPPCRYCSWLLDDLKDEREPQLSRKGTLLLLGELSLLSPLGFRWALPSYLSFVLEDDGDAYLHGELLVSHFSVDATTPEENANQRAQIHILTEAQVDCLVSIIQYLKEKDGGFFDRDCNLAISRLRPRGEDSPNQNS